MPCIPIGSLLTATVGGVNDSFTWEQREGTSGYYLLEVLPLRTTRLHVAHTLPGYPGVEQFGYGHDQQGGTLE